MKKNKANKKIKKQRFFHSVTEVEKHFLPSKQEEKKKTEGKDDGKSSGKKLMREILAPHF